MFEFITRSHLARRGLGLQTSILDLHYSLCSSFPAPLNTTSLFAFLICWWTDAVVLLLL